MKYKRSIALLLALVLLIGCVGFTPAQAAPSAEESDQQPPQSQQILAPDHVDPEQFAQEDHLQRLPEEERLDTYVYLNRDGTKSVYYMGRNVKYKDHNGQVRDKDTTLVREDRGYRMRDNDVELHLPDSPADGITLAYGTDSVRLLPQGGSGSASLADNSITYDSYFGPDTALRYTPLLEGVKEDIILSSYTGQSSFTFILETGGLYLYETDGQYYLAESEGAEAAFCLGQILVYDAVGRPDEGSMTAEALIPGQEYRLTVSADVDFLTDPETVYPVTVDPTLTVSSTVQGSSAIVDAPIYEGYPNRNFGAYVYDRVGYYNDTYQTARTVMRPDALLSSTEWQSLDTDDITGLSLFIKDGSGKSNVSVNVYALTTNSTWTESTVTWNNVGAYFSHPYATAAVGGKNWSEFDLTFLAKAWKNGVLDEDAGFLLKMVTESGYRTIYSCESGTADYRPYMVLTYEAEASLNHSLNDILKGSSLHLVASAKLGISGDVTWTSSDSSIASVNENGVVTGLMAGKATITASFTDNAGNDLSVPCTVYVTVPDGLYYLKNASSGLYLQDGDTLARTFAQETDQTERIPQLWKIAYIGYGKYCIRPIEDLSRALYVLSTGNIGTDDAPVSNTSVESLGQWMIQESEYGYSFKQGGLDAKTMTPIGTVSNCYVTAKAWSDSAIAHWELEEAKGIFLRDTTTLQIITPSTNKIIELGQTYALEDMDLSCEYFGALAAKPTWNSTNSSIAYFDESDEITPLYGGVVNITLTANIDGISYSTSFTLTVIFPLSGYELNYEPDIWNSVYVDSSRLVRNYTNCYAYILNCQIDPAGTDFGCNSTYSIMGFHKQQPGDFYNAHRGSSPEISYSNSDPQSIIDAVEKDFEAYNAYFGTSLQFYQLTDPYSPCPEGSYRVALVIASGIDYHWYRQDSDGYWSHKLGESEVERFDHQGNLILDPRIADRGEYTDYIAFFIVTPWNNLYSSSASSLISETEESTSLRVSNKQSISSSIISRLYIGMSISDALQLIGFAGTDIGNGTIMHVYETSNGGTIKIVYKLDESGVYRISSILEDIV